MIDFIRIGLSIYLLVVALFGVSDFILLRWMVFLVVGILLVVSYLIEKVDTLTKSVFFILFLFIFIIFNPIAPIYLYNRAMWIVIDLISAVVLFMKPVVIMWVDKPFDDVTSDRFDKYVK